MVSIMAPEVIFQRTSTGFFMLSVTTVICFLVLLADTIIPAFTMIPPTPGPGKWNTQFIVGKIWETRTLANIGKILVAQKSSFWLAGQRLR